MVGQAIVSSWRVWLKVTYDWANWSDGFMGQCDGLVLWFGFVRRVGWWIVTRWACLVFSWYDWWEWRIVLWCMCMRESLDQLEGCQPEAWLHECGEKAWLDLRRSYASHWNVNNVLRRGYVGLSSSWFEGWAWGAVARAVRLGLRRSGVGSVKGPGRSWKVVRPHIRIECDWID